ncbi:MAG: M48 family metallopeptidase [Thermoplasmatales archaeon]|nr:M48 family metallopeptidase [Thermoplasmatales archaeon]
MKNEKMPVLEINGKKISCNIKRKDVRHIYLKVKPGFQLEVVLPRNRNIHVESILKKKHIWIEKKIKEISKVKKVFDNDTVLYKGDPVKVKVYTVKKPGKGLRLYKKVILVYEDSKRKKEEVLRDFITRQTLDYVQEKAKRFAKELQLSYNTISTKEMKKWGYCNRNGKLFFNWRLICLPERLADYIVFHEILHLKHFNHSKQFKKDMTKYFIDSKEVEIMLKNYLPY